jgi:hypothetical protein
MLFLLGGEMNTSAVPQKIESERYRAYEIENYDTVSVKIISKDDVELYFFASHVTREGRDPEFVLEFSGGNVVFGGQHKHITGRFNDLREIDYGSPDDHQFKKLFDAIRRVREPAPSICPPEAAIAQTICVNKIQESDQPINTFPSELIMEEKGRRWVSGLGERIGRAYDENKLLSEIL